MTKIITYNRADNFGNNGIKLIDMSGTDIDAFGTDDNSVNQKLMTIDKNNHILISGSSPDNFAIAKIDTKGEYVNSFGTNGKLVLDVMSGNYDTPHSIITDNSNNIIISGESNNLTIVKLDISGNRDQNFGTNGVVNIDISGSLWGRIIACIIDKDNNLIVVGNILLNGTYVLALSKIDNATGIELKTITLDFGQDDIYPEDLVLTENKDNIILCGSINYVDGLVMKLDTDLVIDSNFGPNNDGKVTINLGIFNETTRSMEIDKNGDIVIAHNANGYFKIIKLDSINGDYKTSFGNGGKKTINIDQNSNDSVKDIAIDTENNIFVTGFTGGNRSFFVMKLNETGVIDTDFGDNGIIIFQDAEGGLVNSIELDNNENIFIGGSIYNTINPQSKLDFAVLKILKREKFIRGNYYIYKNINPYDLWIKKRNKKINQ